MKQWENEFKFTRNVAQLINEVVLRGYGITLGEVYRTPEQAQWYAAKGMGILDSQHCKKLAVDISLFHLDGTYLTDKPDYELFGKYWESLHPKNRWGGYFPRADYVHFEMKPD
jgi:hypothetical protein